MSKNTRAELVPLCPEPRLAEVEAGVVGGREIPGSLIDDTTEDIAKNEAAVQGIGEKVSNTRLKLESPRTSEKVVIGESPFGLKKVDGVEAGAQSRFVQRSFGDRDDQNFRRIALPWNLDCGALEEVRLVQRALAAQKFGALEQAAGAQRERLENGAGRRSCRFLR